MSIPAEKWQGIGTWLPRCYGPDPIIFAGGKNNPQLVLESISISSGDADLRDVHTSTGWVRCGEDGTWGYLLASGVHGLPPDLASSITNNLSVELPRELNGYRLSPSYTDEEAVESYGWLSEYFKAGPPPAMAALIGALFLSPIASLVRPGFGVYVSGQSKSRKSTTVAVLLSFFGKFTKDNLPTTFGSTEHAIMKLASQAKDLPLVIDNFVPALDSNRKLMGLARAMGDLSGRGRMEKGTPPPQCLPILTGEDIVQGESSQARLYPIMLYREGPGSIDNTRMAEVERAGILGKTQAAMSHYLGWLSTQLEDPQFIENLKTQQLCDSRAEQCGNSDMGRAYEQTIWLKIGLDLLMHSAPAGLNDKPLEWIDEAKGSLQAHVVRESKTVQESSLAYTFLTMLFALMSCGEIVGQDAKNGGPPVHEPDYFGWRRHGEDHIPINATARRGVVWTLVGKDPKQWKMLVSLEGALAAITRWARPGQRIVESAKAVAMALANAGLTQRGDGGRISQRFYFEGRQVMAIAVDGPQMIKYLQLEGTKEGPPDPDDPFDY